MHISALIRLHSFQLSTFSISFGGQYLYCIQLKFIQCPRRSVQPDYVLHLISFQTITINLQLLLRRTKSNLYLEKQINRYNAS